jgi:hypothetical protein
MVLRAPIFKRKNEKKKKNIIGRRALLEYLYIVKYMYRDCLFAAYTELALLHWTDFYFLGYC